MGLGDDKRFVKVFKTGVCPLTCLTIFYEVVYVFSKSFPAIVSVNSSYRFIYDSVNVFLSVVEFIENNGYLVFVRIFCELLTNPPFDVFFCEYLG